MFRIKNVFLIIRIIRTVKLVPTQIIFNLKISDNSAKQVPTRLIMKRLADIVDNRQTSVVTYGHLTVLRRPTDCESFAAVAPDGPCTAAGHARRRRPTGHARRWSPAGHARRRRRTGHARRWRRTGHARRCRPTAGRARRRSATGNRAQRWRPTGRAQLWRPTGHARRWRPTARRARRRRRRPANRARRRRLTGRALRQFPATASALWYAASRRLWTASPRRRRRIADRKWTAGGRKTVARPVARRRSTVGGRHSAVDGPVRIAPARHGPAIGRNVFGRRRIATHVIPHHYLARRH